MPDPDSSSSAASSSEDESSSSESEEETRTSSNKPHKRARTESQNNDETPVVAPPPLSVAPPVTSTESQAHRTQTARHKKIIVLLDLARLETVKNRRDTYELLNCDDHRDLCTRKLKKDPKQYRPDICHQELLALIDSPLNKAGCLQVYIKTTSNVLVEIHPSIRIPRTYKRFSGLMVQLLHKMKIKASGSSTTLMKVIKNPFSRHLPAGTRVYGMSVGGKLYSPMSLAQAVLSDDPEGDDPPVCFIIGAMAAGHITKDDHPYIEEMFSVSEYPLSGAAAISRILGGIENRWGIV